MTVDGAMDRELLRAVEGISEAAIRQNIPLLAHIGAVASPEMAWLGKKGVTGFIFLSDQGPMQQAALANGWESGSR